MIPNSYLIMILLIMEGQSQIENIALAIQWNFMLYIFTETILKNYGIKKMEKMINLPNLILLNSFKVTAAKIFVLRNLCIWLINL